jgi:hypothetical protein
LLFPDKKVIMLGKKEPKNPGFAMFESDNLTIKGDSPTNVDNDPGYNPRDDELSDDNTRKKLFTNIIHCIIDLCGLPSVSLIVECNTNKAWLTLTNVTTITVDKVEKFCINNKDRLFEAKSMKLHLHKLQCFLISYNSKTFNMYRPLDEDNLMGI